MITRPQAPRRSQRGEYVRVAIADLELGNTWIYGLEPVTHTAHSLDDGLYFAKPGYRWVNGEQRERRSWRDVLVTSLTPAQRAAIVITEEVPS